MAHLTLAGVSDDGKRLRLVDEDGVEHTVDLDDRLRAALRGATSSRRMETKMDSALRPRDIQARIRAGETPEAVAEAAQTSVDKIMAFAAPVLAERQHIADRAQRSSVRRTDGAAAGGARTLGDAVAAHLRTLNVDPDVVEWDAWRREDGRWSMRAGYELTGPVEEIPPAEARRQFDTNFFGLARLTQLVIPGMRARRSGRIINLSSVFGRIAVPGGAYYDASKHAVAGFTGALRLELAAFGIHVILIEPTAALTSLNAKNIVAGGHDGGPYTAFRHDLADWHARTYAGPPRNIAGRLAVSADDVATVIARAASTRRPRARYPVGTLARGLFALQHWLPGRAFDAFIRTQFPAPRQPP